MSLWTSEGETEPSPAVLDKACEYFGMGKVEALGEALLYKVNGSEEYLVVLQGDDYYCTCPSSTTCSHVLAARRMRDHQWR